MPHFCVDELWRNACDVAGLKIRLGRYLPCTSAACVVRRGCIGRSDTGSVGVGKPAGRVFAAAPRAREETAAAGNAAVGSGAQRGRGAPGVSPRAPAPPPPPRPRRRAWPPRPGGGRRGCGPPRAGAPAAFSPRRAGEQFTPPAPPPPPRPGGEECIPPRLVRPNITSPTTPPRIRSHEPTSPPAPTPETRT